MLLVASSSVLAADTHLVRVSRGDPFANCRAEPPGTAKNFRSAEVEPWIADNPAQTANLIGTWQQDRWSNGGGQSPGASGAVAARRTRGPKPPPLTPLGPP